MTTTKDRVGWSATINLPRSGRLTSDEVINARKLIAKAYQVPATSVIIEPWPDGSEHRARLLVLTDRNPLHVPLPYPDIPPLDNTTGRVQIGVYATGEPMHWQLRVPGSGACNGLIAGALGAGKSRLVDNLCIAIHTSPLDVLWLGDTQGGASIPDWTRAAALFAPDVESIRRMMAGLMGALEYRNNRQAHLEWTDAKGRERVGIGHFDPTPDFPQLNVIIEEAPDALADEYVQHCAKVIAQKDRKLGIALDVVTQVPSMDELGGRGVAFRSFVSGFNVACFRTADRYSGNMASANGFPIDPSTLPKFWPDGSSTAGLVLMASAAGGGTNYGRVWHPGDPYDWAELPAAGSLDEGTALAAEDAMEAYDRGQAEAAAKVSSRRESRESRPAPNVRLDATPDPALKNPDRVRKVLREAAGGSLTTGVVADQAGIDLARASETLGRLAARGEVESTGPAKWRIAA